MTVSPEAPAPLPEERAPALPELNAVVVHRAEVSPDHLILRVAPDGWELPEFRSGQFAVLGLPVDAPRCASAEPEEAPPRADRLIRRSYSIASSSVERQYLEFYLVLCKSGALSPRLFQLRIGDRIWLGPKFAGTFSLRDAPPDKNIVLIGAGTGLAPYMSMIRTEALAIAGASRRLVVLHGARHSWDLAYRDELAMLARTCPRFQYVPSITRPAAEPTPWTGLIGRVQEIWSGGLLARAIGYQPAPADTHVFLCGNPEMIEDMLAVLARAGYREHTRKNPGEAHVERFW